MPTHVITYDLDGMHNEVKQICLRNGFHESLTSNKVKFNLPNTTLIIDAPDANAVLDHFKKCVRQVAVAHTQSINIERVFVSQIAVDNTGTLLFIVGRNL